MFFGITTRRGMTLIEMLIYVVILAVLSVAVVGALVVMSRSFFGFKVSQNLNEAGALALERMVREVRRADSIDDVTSVFGTSPGSLTLNSTDIDTGASISIEFTASGGDLLVDEGGTDATSLLPESVNLSELVFRRITTPNSEAVKIEIEVSNTAYGISRDERFYTTTVMRKTY